MTPTATKLLEEALQLSDRDRANLVASLIDSLDPAVDSDWEAAWSQEIARRVNELDEGSVKTVPWSAVRQKLRGRLDAQSNA